LAGGDRTFDLLTIIFWGGTILTIIARFLNIKRIWWCFILWCIGGFIILIQTWLAGQWNIVLYQAVYLLFNIWGLIEWYKLEKKHKLRC
jgi:hypothetical protein